jgi:diguanylate cyclase (GGDEF)-like protein
MSSGPISGGADDPIRKTLALLEKQISDRVRVEQLRHQLTGLPNLFALNEAVKDRIEDEGAFWSAFVEVDHFKSVNDRFGYENADALLTKIAETLRMAVSSWFPGTTTAFHAHGDEFYLLGSTPSSVPEAEIGRVLDLMRGAIQAIRIELRGAGAHTGEMRCTVSVGWLVGSDLTTLTDRAVLTALERAAGEAKRTRNTVTRYTSTLETHDAISLRADCTQCETRFSLDLKRASNRGDDKLWCPNCGSRADRPPTPERVAEVQPEKV